MGIAVVRPDRQRVQEETFRLGIVFLLIGYQAEIVQDVFTFGRQPQCGLPFLLERPEYFPVPSTPFPRLLCM